jgi:replicative DNA helicase
MASFDYTMDMERALLRIVSSNKMMMRMHIHRLKIDRFSSLERQFILEVAKEVYENSGGLLTKTVFEYEVGSKVDDNDRAYFMTEWGLIEALDPKETPETLIGKLDEANLGRETLEVSKQVTELLEAGRVAEAVAHLKQGAVTLKGTAEVGPTVELTETAAREKLMEDKKAHPEKYMGIKTGFETFDRYTGGLFAGELTVFAGITGLGKSTLVRQLEKGIVTHPMNGQKNVLHIANEEYLSQVEHKFDALFTEVPYLRFKMADLSDTEVAAWKQMMENWKYGRVFLKEVPAFTDVTLIEQAKRELEAKGIQVHCIVIDHLPHIKPIQQAWGENDERFKAAADCKELARWEKIPVVVPTQAATVVEEKSKKGQRAGKMDVYGSKGQSHIANTLCIITENGKVEEDKTDSEYHNREDWEKDVYWMFDCKKNRDGAPFWCRMRHYVQIGKIVEVPKDNIGAGAQDDDTTKAADAAIAEADAAEDKQGQGDSTAPAPAPISGPIGEPDAEAAPSSILEKMRERKKDSQKEATPGV